MSSLPLQTSDVVGITKATGDSLRASILRALRHESFGVLELCHIFDTAQPGMSHHLKILLNAGLVSSRREGNAIFYRRALVDVGNPAHDLVATLFAAIDQTPQPAIVTTQIRAVHHVRNEHSREFFSRNAPQLKQNQALIAQYEQYRDAVWHQIENAGFAHFNLATEIGPADSSLIIDLARRFDTVIAVDNSHSMLDKTRSLVDAEGLSNVHLKLGELDALAGDPADLLVLNMVLHHLPSPAAFFELAHRLLKTNGKLLVIDLCPHDQEWVQETCGDQWLGFDPEEMVTWASASGLNHRDESYLGLRNGFQVQIQTFSNDIGDASDTAGQPVSQLTNDADTDVRQSSAAD